MKTPMLIALVLMAVLIVTGAGPAGATTSQTKTAMAKPAADPTLAALSKLNGKDFDVAFMRALIPIHEEAIEIAMAATLNANHTELLQWNQVMIDRKSAQVRSMLAWLQEANAAPGARGAGVVTAGVKQMRSLTGDALERAYLPMMSKHLDRSVALAALAAQKASRAEIKAMAAAIVRVERQESEMLRGWQKKWYGK